MSCLSLTLITLTMYFLLHETLMFSAPIITVDTTTQLEAKIIQRIKDRVSEKVSDMVINI